MYGIIGYPLSHSFSPAYFKEKFERLGIPERYEAFPLLRCEDVSELWERWGDELKGLNVTLPYKKCIIPFLDGLDPVASAVGAVNCVHREGGKKTGYNTDVVGFVHSLLPLLKPWHDRALVLGTGGASLAVRYVLEQWGIGATFVSRSPNNDAGIIAYDEIDKTCIQRHLLVINTTPLGMGAHADLAPCLPYPHLGERHLLYDLIYNPSETVFLQKGRERGAQTKNGQEMLELQAEASWEIWTGKKPSLVPRKV